VGEWIAELRHHSSLVFCCMLLVACCSTCLLSQTLDLDSRGAALASFEELALHILFIFSSKLATVVATLEVICICICDCVGVWVSV
jgi:hypothetical protein